MAPDTASTIERNGISGFASQQAYWDAGLLSSFTFLMAGHGSPVCASMMLGDAGYARMQLRLACTFEDEELQHLAVAMLRSSIHEAPVAPATVQWPH